MKKKRYTFFIIILLFFLPLYVSNASGDIVKLTPQPTKPLDCYKNNKVNVSQRVWAYTFGTSLDDHFRDLIIAKNGDIIVSGITDDGNSNNIWILRVDKNGYIIWEKSIDWIIQEISTQDRSFAIIESNDGGLIVVGDSNNQDAVIVKLTANGDFVWQTIVPDTSSHLITSIAATQDDGFVLTGYMYHGHAMAWILKINSTGGIVWERSLDEIDPTSIIVTWDGNIVVTGRIFVAAGNADFWVLKLNQDGNLLWQKKYGKLTLVEEASSIIETNDHGYLVVGTSHKDTLETYKGWIIKIDADGNLIWQKSYGRDKFEGLGDAVETNSGDLLIVGNSQSYRNGENTMWLMKLSSLGEIIWQRNNWAGSAGILRQNSDGNIVIGGETSFGAGQIDILIMNMDVYGNVGDWCYTIDGLADNQSTTAAESIADNPLMNYTSTITTRDISIQDTYAESYWLCPWYIRFLPFINRN